MFSALVAYAVIFVAPTVGSFTGGVQFIENSSLDFDHGHITDIPTGFGDGEFTLKISFMADDNYSFGETTTNTLTNWSYATEEKARYSEAFWWDTGNWLLDGHNNAGAAYYNGTFSVMIYGSGRVRWLLGDGSTADALTGDLWAIQPTPTNGGINVVDGEIHTIHMVRRWSGASDADLELWVDGTLEETETSTARTDLTQWWEPWTGWNTGEEGWHFASEKQAALGSTDFPDFKGIIYEVTFYDAALSSSQIADDQGPVDTGLSGYVDHFAFEEGTGSTTDSAGSITMDLNNPGDFWP